MHIYIIFYTLYISTKNINVFQKPLGISNKYIMYPIHDITDMLMLL